MPPQVPKKSAHSSTLCLASGNSGTCMHKATSTIVKFQRSPYRRLNKLHCPGNNMVIVHALQSQTVRMRY